MGFLGYLLLGGVVYSIGFLLNLKLITPKQPDAPTHKRWVAACVLGCFVVMLVVSALIGRFILAHAVMDLMFIVVNSLVATVVFYFGLNPDKSNMKLPH